MARIRLKVPLSKRDVRDLKLGDLVSLDGYIFTGAQLFHQRVMQGILPPIDFRKADVLLHVMPVMRETDGKRQLLALTPTSSIKFEVYNPQIIKHLGVRAMLGKTTVGPETMGAMKEFGCVHLTRLGTPDNVLVHQTKRIVAIYFEKELGITEATLLLDVEDFGPFIVDVDAHGHNLYYQREKETERRLKDLYIRFGIPADFNYEDTKLVAHSRD